MIEQFAVTKIGEHVFQGYIDFVFQDEDGTITILDWKTVVNLCAVINTTWRSYGKN